MRAFNQHICGCEDAPVGTPCGCLTYVDFENPAAVQHALEKWDEYFVFSFSRNVLRRAVSQYQARGVEARGVHPPSRISARRCLVVALVLHLLDGVPCLRPAWPTGTTGHVCNQARPPLYIHLELLHTPVPPSYTLTPYHPVPGLCSTLRSLSTLPARCYRGSSTATTLTCWLTCATQGRPRLGALRQRLHAGQQQLAADSAKLRCQMFCWQPEVCNAWNRCIPKRLMLPVCGHKFKAEGRSAAADMFLKSVAASNDVEATVLHHIAFHPPPTHSAHAARGPVGPAA